MADRTYRNRERYERSRQAEQFDPDQSWRDEERDQNQMGESWSRDDEFSRYDTGRDRHERERPGYDDRARSDGGGYSARHGAHAPHREREVPGFASFTGSDQSGRDFSHPRYGYGAASRSAGAYGAAPREMYRGDEHDGRGFLERAGDEVASWFGDEDAARRREMDHRGRGPAGYTRSDDRILEDACDALTEDWRVDARQIQVTVQNGEITLDGTVPTREQKRRAEDCIENISGVRHVQNNVRVEEAGSRDRDGTRPSREAEPSA